MLTLMGSTFPGRVAASLLSAVGLSELITHTPEEYEKRAIELACDQQTLKTIQEHLINNLLTSPLFDTALFTQNLEVVYKKMVERHDVQLAPEHIC